MLGTNIKYLNNAWTKQNMSTDGIWLMDYMFITSALDNHISRYYLWHILKEFYRNCF